MSKKFYVTTPIYYPNDIPHIGHAYTTIVADVLARWNSLKGKDVYFLTGTDDHGKKIADSAQEKGKSPKEFVDELVPKFKDAWKKLNISYDRFIRTTDKDHEKLVQEVLQKIWDKDKDKPEEERDIYLGEYEGLYCTGCEAYYTEKDLFEGSCPIHKTKIEKLKEKSYFFRLSKYQDELLRLYKKNEKFISPEFRKKEIINRVEEGLRDLSISRTGFDWGVPLPFDKDHVCYVWFDALFNYYTGAKNSNEKFWPCDVHLIGKDIMWFHTVYWPAFLLAAGIELPKKVFAHGWWTFNNEKISKSRGKVINIDELISLTGNADSVRYFLCRATPFGDDGDFSREALINRHNGELLNKLGNLVSRTSGLIEKIGFEEGGINLLKKLNEEKIEELMKNFELDKALNEIFAFVDSCNEYIQNQKPWETKDKKVLYELRMSILKIAELLWTFIPETSEKIKEKFSAEKITKGENLFEKVEFEEKINKEEKIFKTKESKPKSLDKPKTPEGIMTTSEVNFEDWSKLDLRVAEIEEANDIEGADKLYKLNLDVGELGKRVICAGIKENYDKEELVGKKIIYFSNLKPRKMRGIESQGMLLAASTEGHKEVVLISPSGEIANGSRVG